MAAWAWECNQVRQDLIIPSKFARDRCQKTQKSSACRGIAKKELNIKAGAGNPPPPAFFVHKYILPSRHQSRYALLPSLHHPLPTLFTCSLSHWHPKNPILSPYIFNFFELLINSKFAYLTALPQFSQFILIITNHTHP